MRARLRHRAAGRSSPAPRSTDVVYPVRFYGSVHDEVGLDGVQRRVWSGGEMVMAVAYDNPIPGYDTFNTINLRLFRAAPAREFDLASFNTGDYTRAIEQRQRAEAISSVLYPSDASPNGKELRLKQQYFFASATLRDVIRRFKRMPGWEWKHFGVKNALQLNDTHPTIAIPDLMRILVDEEGVAWDDAWAITTVRGRARQLAGGGWRRAHTTTTLTPHPPPPSPLCSRPLATPTTRCCPRRWSGGAWS